MALERLRQFGKRPEPRTTPEAIHNATLSYEERVARHTKAVLGRMAARDSERPEGEREFRHGEEGELPLVMPPSRYHTAKAVARELSGEHPAITLTAETPAITQAGQSPQDAVSPGESAFLPGTTTPLGEGGVTVNPSATPRPPEVQVNPPK